MLDYKNKTKRCSLCSRYQAKLGEDTSEFTEWFDGHKDKRECNHEGSSPTMEMEAATELFSRSEEYLHLQYTQVISDGDSKTIGHLYKVK